MTYDQIEKMDKQDLVYAFKRLTEIADEMSKRLGEMETLFNDREEDFCPYSHIGFCEASFSIVKHSLDSVIEVVTEK